MYFIFLTQLHGSSSIPKKSSFGTEQQMPQSPLFPQRAERKNSEFLKKMISSNAFDNSLLDSLTLSQNNFYDFKPASNITSPVKTETPSSSLPPILPTSFTPIKNLPSTLPSVGSLSLKTLPPLKCDSSKSSNSGDSRKGLNRASSPSSPGAVSSHTRIIDVDLSNMFKISGGPSGRGFVGLKNIGNSCYMNSVLQCLIATRSLIQVFFTGEFKRFLNPSNPLSTKGACASAFSDFISKILREENGVAVSPSSFKEIISKYSSQFAGTDQQDSQEFLAFLLDSLHEDLNQGLMVKGGVGFSCKSLPEWVKRNPSEKEEEEDQMVSDLVLYYS
jgi:hypothetical protein